MAAGFRMTEWQVGCRGANMTFEGRQEDKFECRIGSWGHVELAPYNCHSVVMSCPPLPNGTKIFVFTVNK